MSLNKLQDAMDAIDRMSMAGDGFRIKKALVIIIDEVVRLRAEEQRLTNEIVQLKLAAARNA